MCDFDRIDRCGSPVSADDSHATAGRKAAELGGSQIQTDAFHPGCFLRIMMDAAAEAEHGTLRIDDANQATLLMQVVPWKTPLSPELSEASDYVPDSPDFQPPRLGAYRPSPGLGASSVVPYRTIEDAAALIPRIKNALSKLPTDYDALLAAHVRIHGDLFARCSLDLGGGADRSTPIDVLLARAAEENRMSPALMETLYDACRYLTICSSGERVPNLQGIWAGSPGNDATREVTGGRGRVQYNALYSNRTNIAAARDAGSFSQSGNRTSP